ncbi:hypothetical protein [Nocardioides zeicaulis]|uniref:Uncharacterized protein n=1 Tax=Nocardioides zeicaulis TaxID=1776857 RepID=A0ABV6DXQ1_9ACTN
MSFDDHDWYAPRYPGPPINTAAISPRIAIDDSIAQTDRRSRCWDELCDGNPDLVAWTGRLRAACGDAHVTWKFVETDAPPVLRSTRAGNVICTFSDDLVIGPQDDHTMKAMLIETMAVCARAFGVAPPPFGAGRAS